MAKKDEFKYEIKEVIGNVSESDKNNWTKSLTKIKWNDRPVTLDWRRINLTQNIMGSGITLGTDEEIDKLVDMLLELGYGSTEIIEDAYKSRMMKEWLYE